MKKVHNLKLTTILRQALLAAGLGLWFASSASAAILITEVDPSGSSSTSNTYNADWFELTNTGSSAQDITGWKMDDNSNSFALAVPLREVTSIGPGQSVVFIEGNTSGSNDATVQANFIQFWFGGNAPAGFTIGGYGGAGVGLSQTADAVNIFDASGNEVTGVQFAASPVGTSFDNTAGIGSSTQPLPFISTLSAVGVNGAFDSVGGSPHEVGSPGVAVVPEPSTIVLASMGLLLAWAALARRQRFAALN